MHGLKKKKITKGKRCASIFSLKIFLHVLFNLFYPYHLCLLPLPILCLISKPLHCSAQLKRVHIFLKGWLNLIISLTSSLPSKWSSTELEGFVLEGEPVTGMRGAKDTERGESKCLFSFHRKINREITLQCLIAQRSPAVINNSTSTSANEPTCWFILFKWFYWIIMKVFIGLLPLSDGLFFFHMRKKNNFHIWSHLSQMMTPGIFSEACR